MMSSERSNLKKQIGRLHLQVLLKERGYKCEICNQEADEDTQFARFHILTVGAQPRLEFVDDNVLVYIKDHWYKCHEPYHHDRDSKAGQKIMKAIIALRGPDYKEKLQERARFMSQHNKMYLLALKRIMENQLK
jgi:hypothetical protein